MIARSVSPNVETALELIDALKPGECRTVEGVSWDEYEELLAELGEGCGVRVAFTEGTLELMAPLYRHEKHKDAVLLMVGVLTQELGLDMQSAGSTTLRLKGLQRGAEPDTCFYVQNAGKLLGREEIDLRRDPPPDIVFEVDVTSQSTSKMKTYARMGVPEFWRYDGREFYIYELSGGRYAARENSPTFPFVRADDLRAFLERGRTEGQAALLRSFRAWVLEKIASG
jgi:Uma2 family endonuclease